MVNAASIKIKTNLIAKIHGYNQYAFDCWRFSGV